MKVGFFPTAISKLLVLTYLYRYVRIKFRFSIDDMSFCSDVDILENIVFGCVYISYISVPAIGHCTLWKYICNIW